MRLQLFGLGAVVAFSAAAGALSCSAYDPEHVAELQNTVTPPISVSFQNGVLPANSYSGNIDASIKQGASTTNFGAATSLEAALTSGRDSHQ